MFLLPASTPDLAKVFPAFAQSRQLMILEQRPNVHVAAAPGTVFKPAGAGEMPTISLASKGGEGLTPKGYGEDKVGSASSSPMVCQQC